jgi:type I restriction enzyme S subunit
MRLSQFVETTPDQEDIPEGWILTRLRDGLIIDVQPGFACGKNTRDGQGIPHLRPMNVSEKGQIDLYDLKFVPESECSKSERFVNEGDVIFNNTNSPALVGKTAYYNLPEPRAFSNHMTRLRCNKGIIDPVFCAMVLHQKWREGYFKSVCNNHVSQSSISRQVLLDTTILLPTIAEQQSIVARVEALLTHINATRDRLSRVPLAMKKFRLAVLAAACSGGLTEGWRNENPSTETSDQLIRHVTQEPQKSSAKNKNKSVVQLTQWYKPELLELLEIPENWTWIAVKDATSLMQYGISVKSDSDEKNGFPILRMGNIQEGSIDLTDLKFIPANTESISNFIVETGDILFNRTNSPELVGKSAVYNEKLRAVFASYLVRVRPNTNLILSEYLCWWINSMWGREWARNVRTDGVSQSNINAQKLSVMPVPLPPLAEQHEIVHRVGSLFERADAFESKVATATKRTEALTQAVLGKAFRGEL